MHLAVVCISWFLVSKYALTDFIRPNSAKNRANGCRTCLLSVLPILALLASLFAWLPEVPPGKLAHSVSLHTWSVFVYPNAVGFGLAFVEITTWEQP